MAWADPHKEGTDLEGEPILEFQPAVDLSTGLLLGFEALVRWSHPKRGLVHPDVLLPWAERTGYMSTLSAWVFGEACIQAASWPSGIQLAVNASAGELRGGRVSTAALRALESSGLNPDRLTVEVTETTVEDDSARRDLLALARIGAHLAVDDVGTSWSTLENLRRFSIKTAKIDRKFIAGLEPEEGMNRAIVEAIIHVSRSLAISTVAEGVENRQQVAVLKEIGAEVGQGFFFARPMPSDAAHKMANAEPRQVFDVGVSQDDLRPRLISVIAPADPQVADEVVAG